MLKKHDNEHGFTLVEMLVAIAVLSVLLLGLSNFAKVSFGAYNNTSKAIEKNNQLRIALDKVFEEIRTAQKIEPSAAKNSLTYRRWSDTTDRELKLGSDNIIYNGGKAISKQKVRSLTCDYNSSDSDKKTIDITIELDDSTKMSVTVRALNR